MQDPVATTVHETTTEVDSPNDNAVALGHEPSFKQTFGAPFDVPASRGWFWHGVEDGATLELGNNEYGSIELGIEIACASDADADAAGAWAADLLARFILREQWKLAKGTAPPLSRKDCDVTIQAMVLSMGSKLSLSSSVGLPKFTFAKPGMTIRMPLADPSTVYDAMEAIDARISARLNERVAAFKAAPKVRR